MYLRTVHAEEDREGLYDVISQHPLGVLTTFVEASTQQGKDADEATSEAGFPLMQSTHIPWTLERGGGRWQNGVLRGHMARANPHAKQLLDQQKRQQGAEHDSGSECVVAADHLTVLFTHAVESYVSPRYYTDTKPKTGKVVPTWNYAAVEVRGTLRLHDSSSAFLDDQIRQLTRENEPKSIVPSEARQEAQDNGKDHAGWNVSDAPTPYVDILKRAIVGVEVEIKSIVGKFKMSQESNKEDRRGVIEGFRKVGTQQADQMADLVEARGELYSQKQKQ